MTPIAHNPTTLPPLLLVTPDEARLYPEHLVDSQEISWKLSIEL